METDREITERRYNLEKRQAQRTALLHLEKRQAQRTADQASRETTRLHLTTARKD